MSNLRTYRQILITGANRGLGLEFVRQYAQSADKIFACCRSPENAHELNELSQAHGNIDVIPLDVTNDAQIEALKQRLSQASLDLLINNAGIMRGRDGMPELDKNDWLETFAVNTLSPVHITMALKDNLTKQAVVANITSKMGSIADNGSGGAIIYRSSKAALNAAIKSVAIDNADNFYSVLLHPGWVRTDMGGPNGWIDVATSISGMREVLSNFRPEQNGQFLNYDGSSIPW